MSTLDHDGMPKNIGKLSNHNKLHTDIYKDMMLTYHIKKADLDKGAENGADADKLNIWLSFLNFYSKKLTQTSPVLSIIESTFLIKHFVTHVIHMKTSQKFVRKCSTTTKLVLHYINKQTKAAKAHDVSVVSQTKLKPMLQMAKLTMIFLVKQA